jgi:hypothetical protein
MGVDDFIQLLPGSNLKVKGFVTAIAVTILMAVPIFGGQQQTRQGHDYMSSDKPESIRAEQERQRKEYRQSRKNKEQQQQQEE